jgi:hypothetical protein
VTLVVPVPRTSPVSLPCASRGSTSWFHVSDTPPAPATVALPVSATCASEAATASETDVPQRDVKTAS